MLKRILCFCSCTRGARAGSPVPRNLQVRQAFWIRLLGDAAGLWDKTVTRETQRYSDSGNGEGHDKQAMQIWVRYRSWTWHPCT